ncbi:hypothetical protein ACFVWR_15465 [Leifsonia sp. NPDC058292]|uniref:hypothetical protein n=1 Tax=Leifsonia sp. NPDC058292 TaxID=3346428 RepID=UPI0036D76695
MKKFAIVVTVLVMALSGCSATVPVADKATPTATATPTPTPVLMTVDEAGPYYLATVCPANVAASANNAAYVAQDLATIQSTGAAARDAYQSQIKQFTDPMKVWPANVAADIKTLVDSDFQTVSLLDSVAHAASLDVANTILFPDEPNVRAAAQRIRLTLGLSADTSAGC